MGLSWVGGGALGCLPLPLLASEVVLGGWAGTRAEQEDPSVGGERGRYRPAGGAMSQITSPLGGGGTPSWLLGCISDPKQTLQRGEKLTQTPLLCVTAGLQRPPQDPGGDAAAGEMTECGIEPGTKPHILQLSNFSFVNKQMRLHWFCLLNC